MKIKDVEFENNVFLAPMAGIADRAFRELCINYGAGYTVSEMVSSKGLTMGDKKSGELLTLGEIENPAGVQIFGDNPEIMAQAAKMCIKYHPNIIDINMGCPAPKIAMNGGGASLMKNPLLAGEIIKAVSKAVDIPVTVKIRKGWDDENITAVELAKIAEKNGAAAITVHGRTRMQMYSGKVDYDIIAKVKKAVDIVCVHKRNLQWDGIQHCCQLLHGHVTACHDNLILTDGRRLYVLCLLCVLPDSVFYTKTMHNLEKEYWLLYRSSRLLL